MKMLRLSHAVINRIGTFGNDVNAAYPSLLSYMRDETRRHAQSCDVA